MKIPLIQKLMLEKEDLRPSNLKVKLSSLNWGQGPVLVHFSPEFKEHLQVSPEQASIIMTILNFMLQFLIDQHHHPRFPYPVYVVSNLVIPQGPFPVLSEEHPYESVLALPRHFHPVQVNIGPKEKILLKKLEIELEKFRNLDIYQVQRDINKVAGQDRRLFECRREATYYGRLLKSLMKEGQRQDGK